MSAPIPALIVPRSILDTDLYKLTMQQAVLHHFPHVQATYRFTNRDKTALFSRQSIEHFRTAVSHFASLALSQTEHDWLKQTCPFFTPAYLAYLSAYRYKPEQVKITFVPLTDDGLFGNVDIDMSGPWIESILWEVPLMACLSETYFQSVVTDWNYDNQEEAAYAKARTLLEAGCVISEFGTRRRRSYQTQDLVIETFLRASTDISSTGRLSGTSNVHFAQKHGIPVIGTIAHEWFMGVASLKGYEHANAVALDLWEEVYHKANLIALTDTFSSDAFFKEFAENSERANRWTGLRQDSGDPFKFAPRAKEIYESLGIDPRNKSIVFSDSLNVDKAIRLQNQCNELGFTKVGFGIGTFLTNDFMTSDGTEKSKALNMVIKLSSVNGTPCVKISDDLNKNTGDSATVEHVKRVFGLPN